jgi:translation initiation factor 2A
LLYIVVKPDPETNQVHLNLLVHCIATGEVFYQFAQKAQYAWAPQWTENESMFGRLTSNAEVSFFSTSDLGVKNKLRANNITAFSLSPGGNPHVAIFIPESKNGNPAVVKLFSLGNFNVPISNKTFFKADKVKFLWNSLGTGVLVLTSTEVDTTGQSYYGETNLYYMSTAGNWDCRVALGK